MARHGRLPVSTFFVIGVVVGMMLITNHPTLVWTISMKNYQIDGRTLVDADTKEVLATYRELKLPTMIERRIRPGVNKPDDFTPKEPFDIDAHYVEVGENACETLYGLSASLGMNPGMEDTSDWLTFEIRHGTRANYNAVALNAVDDYLEDDSAEIYVNVALLGNMSEDARFEPIPEYIKLAYGIQWDLPEGYGAVLGLNKPPLPGYKRKTIQLFAPVSTSLVSETPASKKARSRQFYVPYNSGELNMDVVAAKELLSDANDRVFGVLGCVFPEEFCYDGCFTGKSGDFCGYKTQGWRWIKETDLGPGKYYVVFWETHSKPTHALYLSGWRTLQPFDVNEERIVFEDA